MNHREMARAWALWKYGEAFGGMYHSGNFDDWSEKRSDSHPFGAFDGVSVAVTREGDPENRWYEKAEGPRKPLDLLNPGLLRPDNEGPNAGDAS